MNGLNIIPAVWPRCTIRFARERLNPLGFKRHAVTRTAWVLCAFLLGIPAYGQSPSLVFKQDGAVVTSLTGAPGETITYTLEPSPEPDGDLVFNISSNGNASVSFSVEQWGLGVLITQAQTTQATLAILLGAGVYDTNNDTPLQITVHIPSDAAVGSSFNIRHNGFDVEGGTQSWDSLGMIDLPLTIVQPPVTEQPDLLVFKQDGTEVVSLTGVRGETVTYTLEPATPLDDLDAEEVGFRIGSDNANVRFSFGISGTQPGATLSIQGIDQPIEITVHILADSATGTFNIQHHMPDSGSPTEWQALDQSLTLMIIDPAATISVSDATGYEDGPDLEFTVTLSQTVNEDVTVRVATSHGTADGKEFEGRKVGDYWGEDKNVTIPANSRSVVVAVNQWDESADENLYEQFSLNLSNARPSTVTILDGTGIATIIDDDDPPVFRIEGRTRVPENAGDVVFTVIPGATSSQDTVIAYEVVPGTATAGADYTAPLGGTIHYDAYTANATVTYTDGSEIPYPVGDYELPEILITVPILADAETGEGPETFRIRLIELPDPSNPGAFGQPGNATAHPTLGNHTVTIHETTTDMPVLSATAVNPIELDIRSPSIDAEKRVLRYELSGVPSSDVVFTQFALKAPSSPGIGVAVHRDEHCSDCETSDYIDGGQSGGTITIPAGSTAGLFGYVEIPIHGDQAEEPDETLVMRLSEISGATFAGGGSTLDVTVTIIDDDDPPEMTILGSPRVEVAEGDADGTVVFTIQASATSTRDTTVAYRTTAATATEGTDYTATTGTITMRAYHGSAAGQPAVDYIDNATDEINYPEFPITVPITGDNAVDAAVEETFTFGISAVGGTDANGLGNATVGGLTSVTVVIRDDDVTGPQVSFVGDPAPVPEGSAMNPGQIVFTAEINTAPTGSATVEVEYATVAGTAGSTTGGWMNDYTQTSGTLTFTSTTTLVPITVPLVGDDGHEDTQTFRVRLSNASTGATIGDAEATGTIDDDDGVPILSLSGPQSAAEGAGAQTYTVTLSNPTSKQVRVAYQTSSGPAPAAVAGTDYTTAMGTLTINTSSPSAALDATTFQVTVGGQDTVSDGSKNFGIGLVQQDGGNAYVGTRDNYVSVTIIDDEFPTVGITGDAAAERSAGSIEFEVTLSEAPGAEATVAYATSASSPAPAVAAAAAGTDYTETTGVLTFSTTETTKTITVPLLGSGTKATRRQTFEITLSNPSNLRLNPTATTATGTVLNEFIGLIFLQNGVEVTSLTGTEGGTVRYSVRLGSQLSTSGGRVPELQYSIGGDLIGSGSTLNFQDMNEETPQTVTVTIDQDADTEDATTHIVHSIESCCTGDVPEYAALGRVNLPLTITDDDTTPRDVVLNPTELRIPRGSVRQYTVRLATAPTSNLTIDPILGGARVNFQLIRGDGLHVHSYSLTFTPTDWNQDQTVTVTSQRNLNPDHLNGAIGHHMSTLPDDPQYHVLFTDMQVVTIDPEPVGISLAVSPTTVAEDGGEQVVTVTAAWNEATFPDDRVVTVTTAAGTATADGTDYGGGDGEYALTIPGGEGSGTTSFTLTANDDDLMEEPETIIVTGTITLAVGEVTGTTTITMTDDDSPGFDFDPGSVTVAEGEATTYTVQLYTQPTDAVTLTPTIADANKATISVAEALTFSNASWNQPQTVTVTGVQDDDGRDAATSITHAVTGDSEYSPLMVPSIPVNITDDDDTGLVFNPTSVSVREDAADNIASYTVVLATEPLFPVEVGNIRASDPAKVTVTPTSLSFATTKGGTNGWDVAQTVTVTGAQDDDSVSEALSITHDASSRDPNSSDFDSDYSFTGRLPLTFVDDDSPLAFTDTTATNADLDLTAGLVLAEDGTVSYRVVLTSAPAAAVSVTIASSDATKASVTSPAAPHRLVFTTTEGGMNGWNVPRTVTLAGTQDDDADSESISVTHTLSGTGFAGEQVDMPVAVTDDDKRGLSLTPTSLMLNEQGDVVTYAVALATRPSGNVQVTVTPENNKATVAATGTLVLTFTADAWNTAQTVTVSAAADVDGDDDMVTIAHAFGGADAQYNALEDVELIAAIADNDTPGLVFNPASVQVNEGDAASYTVRATTQPDGDVVLALSVGAGATLSETSLTLAMAAGGANGWDVPQTVTVTAAEDDDNSSNEVLTITHTGTSTDADYAVPFTLPVAVADNDSILAFTDAAGMDIPSTQVLTVTEGATLNYGVKLVRAPTAAVTVSLMSNDADKVTVAPPTLTFDATDWRDAKPIVVTGGEDDDGDDDAAMVEHAVSGAGIEQNPVRVRITVTDNDTHGLVFEPNPVAVDEGETAEYAVRLGTLPMDAVTVTLTQDHAELSLSDTSLTFAAQDWSTAQTITVTAAHDDDGRTDTGTISHALASSDADYGALADVALAVTITDDDEPGVVFHSADGTGPAASVEVEEGASATYTVVLATEPMAEVTIALTTDIDDKAALAPVSLTFAATKGGTDGWNVPRTITVSGTPDDDGRSERGTITHAAASTDTDYTASLPLPLAVDDDDAPELLSVGITEGTGPGQGRDTYGFAEKIRFTARFSGLVRVRGVPQLKLSIGSAPRWADFEPRADAAQGSATVVFAYTVRAGDVAAGGISIPGDPLEMDREGGDVIADAENPAGIVEEEIAAGSFEVDASITEGLKIDGSKDFMLSASAGENKRANEGDAVTLTGTAASSGDPGDLEYAWTQRLVGGDADDRREEREVELTRVSDEGGELVVTFEAPDNLTFDTVLTFVFEVENPETEETRTDEMQVTIKAENELPVAVIKAPDAVNEKDVVTLDGSDSRDPEGHDIVGYSWRQQAGNEPRVTLEDADKAKATFVSPINVPNGTQLIFELTVTDIGGAESNPARKTIRVNAKDFADVLGHALSRFGRALGASAVDTLGERFGGMSKRNPGASRVSLGNTELASLAQLMPVAAHGGSPNTTGPNMTGLEPAAHMGTASGAGYVVGSSTNNEGANAATVAGPVIVGHFDERLRVGDHRSLPIPQSLDRNTLLRSSFEIGLPGNNITGIPEPGTGMGGLGGLGGIDWTLWGRFDTRTFEADPEEAMTLEGSVTIGYVGVDGCLSDCTGVVGMALGSASSDVEFKDADGLEGDISLSMLGFYPYGSWEFSPSLTAWGMLGTGTGSAEITSDIGHKAETDIGMLLLAAGAHQNLGLRWNLVELALKGDVFMVNTSADAIDQRLGEATASVQRARAGLEASQPWLLNNRVLLRPSLTFSGRMDGGDAETGFGAEFDAGLALKDESGLSVEMHGRFLLLHQDEGISESGFSVMVHYDPDIPGGLVFALSPTWGNTGSVGNALWDGDRLMLGGLAGSRSPRASRGLRPDAVDTELHYAILLTDWTLAPYGTFRLQGHSGYERLGLRLESMDMRTGTLNVDLFGERHADQPFTPGLEGTLRFFFR